MQNEFLKLASSPLMNLDHTYRYSGTKLVEAESLSQHITDTIMMGLKIIDKVNSLSEYELIDSSKYLMKAVYHDLEEVITGDIPRPLKYYNEATLASMKDVAGKVAYEFFTKEFSDGKTQYEIWDTAKDGVEGYILKLVDTLVVAHKVVKEVSMLNNCYMLRVAHEVLQYITEQYNYFEKHKNEIFPDQYQASWYISNLIEDTIATMNSILAEYQSRMHDLNISGMSMI